MGKLKTLVFRILAPAMAVILLAGCSAEDIGDIINETVNEIIDNTVDDLVDGTVNNLNGSGSSGPGDEHWDTPASGGSQTGNSGASDGDDSWGLSGLGGIFGNTGSSSGDGESTELPPPQPGITVPTLEEDMAGDTYGLLYPKPREAYVGREYFRITDEKSFVKVVHEGLYRGIRGIVMQYEEHDYNYWKDLFDRVVNRSEFGGFVKAGFLVEPEENKTIGVYPVFNEAWQAVTYYRYREPEIGEDAMKVLRAAHELAEDAMKACPGDERGILRYVNNKICNLTSYADPIPHGLDVPERDATGVFIKGSCVCAGYAVTYRLVLEILGIENCVIVNAKEPDDPAYHIWNYVKLDGNWYHVDVTWNDSDSDIGRNRYFLLTDDELKKETEGGPSAFAHEWVPLYVY